MSYTSISQLINTTFSLRRDGYTPINLNGIAITAAAATSTIEVFEGEIGVVDDAGELSINAAGTGYSVGDNLTIPTPDPNGTDLIIEVATVGGSGEVLTFTLVQAGTGFRNGDTIASTGGGGSGATFDIDTATNPGTSIIKLSTIANLSEQSQQCILVKGGVLSVLVTGASAQGYLYHA